MPSTNGHGPKQAILYARVSTDEQARSGYSLAQQMEALQEHAAREGYEVLEEVFDRGQSGASLERPGMDRVRDLVAAGGVSVVLAQDRDRFAREPAYHYLLRREFEEHGCKIRALNDRGDESPEGELTDGILDQLGKYERAKLTERTRRGKLRRAREGKIIPNRRPNFGFAFNGARDNYVVDEGKMRVVQRIFRMIGTEGRTLNAVKRVLEAEGVPTPTGNRRWHTRGIRDLILEDVYKPHHREEVEALAAEGLITQEVFARLCPDERYGIWWFNRERITRQRVAEATPGGRLYRDKVKAAAKARKEWIAVPVPDSGIPREVVDAAQEAIIDNKPTSSNGHRFWELSGGILRCAVCRLAMRTHVAHKGTKRFYYYHCRRHHEEPARCANRKHQRAETVERQVRDLVYEAMTNPEQLRADLDRMISIERQALRGEPDREAKTWLEKLAEVDRMRSGYQEMAAKGLMTFEELGARLEELKSTRDTAEHELEVLRSRQERIEQMERDRNALLESYAGMAPQALDSLTPEECHQLYKMLRLEVVADKDGEIEVTGPIMPNPVVCNAGSAYWPRSGGS